MTLTNKQIAFINEYLKSWNASDAALKAGYKKRQSGAENMSNPVIKAAIDERIKEMTMSADEALIRLSEQARADMSDFIEIKAGQPFVDLNKAVKNGKLHLLKKFNNTDKGIMIELYDAQAALVHILREQHLKAGESTDNLKVDDNLTDEQRATRIAQLLESARAKRDRQAAESTDSE